MAGFDQSLNPAGLKASRLRSEVRRVVFLPVLLAAALLALPACDLGVLKSYRSSADIGVKTNLMLAVEHGDPREVRKLLDEGADADAWHKEQTALHYAVLRVPAKPDIVRMLVATGTALDAKGDGTTTPLILAARNKRVDLVELLIDLGADVNKEGYLRERPLVIWVTQIAGESSHPDRERQLAVTRKMIEAGAEPNLYGGRPDWASRVTPIQPVAAEHDIELLRMLLDAGANPNLSTNTTPLENALGNPDTTGRKMEAVNLLLSSGAHPDVGGLRALAGLRDQRDSVRYGRLLLEVGVDPTLQDRFGYTPLMHAVQATNIPLLDLLLDTGSDLDARSYEGGLTALMIANGPKSHEVAKMLLDAGADPDVRDNKGRTALVGHARGRKAKILLDAGADPNIRDNSRRTALFPLLDERTVDLELARKLIRAGAELNAADHTGETVLIGAAWRGHTEFARLLINSGADTGIKDKHGKTALSYVEWNDHEMRKILTAPSGKTMDPQKTEGTP